MTVSPSIRSFRDAVILLLWGVFVFWITGTGQLSTYLHPSLQRFTIAGGVMLLVLAFFAFRGIFARTASGSTHHCCHHHEPVMESGHHHHGHDGGCDHSHEGHSHGEEPVSPGSFLFKTTILLIPLLVIVMGNGNRFTMTTVQNRGVVDNLDKLPSAKASQSSQPSSPSTQSTTPSVADSGSDNAPSTASGSMPIQVIDLLYAIQMPSYRSEFDGKQVELTGQFVPLTTGNPKGDRFQAIRMFITCCAADAKPVGVTIQYSKPLNLSEMSWVKITGKPTFPMEGGRRTAILEATKVEECPAPAEPFVY
jgi:uncharacterized repeat protein (TIGR03943 family)